MLTQLLALEVQTAPPINSELIETEALFKKHRDCANLEDLTVLATLARRDFETFSQSTKRINLANLEKDLGLAKHAPIETEDDFV